MNYTSQRSIHHPTERPANDTKRKPLRLRRSLPILVGTSCEIYLAIIPAKEWRSPFSAISLTSRRVNFTRCKTINSVAISSIQRRTQFDFRCSSYSSSYYSSPRTRFHAHPSAFFPRPRPGVLLRSQDVGRARRREEEKNFISHISAAPLCLRPWDVRVDNEALRVIYLLYNSGIIRSLHRDVLFASERGIF